MVGIGEDGSDERQGRQERRGWQIPHVRGFPPLPGANSLNGETAGSMTRLGIGMLAVLGVRRRSLLLGGILVLAMMTALVVAQLAGPQGQSGPSPAFAQTCPIPVITVTAGGGVLQSRSTELRAPLPRNTGIGTKMQAQGLGVIHRG